MLTYTPILYLPQIVCALLDENRPGAYVLGSEQDFKIGYVGRSDTCVRRRLAFHNHLYKFDYFIYRYAKNAEEAYMFECEAYHALERRSGMLNKYHPAAPRGTSLFCPYCSFAEDVKQFLLAA